MARRPDLDLPAWVTLAELRDRGWSQRRPSELARSGIVRRVWVDGRWVYSGRDLAAHEARETARRWLREEGWK